MPNSNQSAFGVARAMTDPFEFMQKMWQGTSLPGIAMPTLSVEEINKKITDLKAVESWLTLNMSMLRGTIQTLEVQSGTLSALQSMSAALGAGNQPAVQPDKSATNPAEPKFESPFTTGATGAAGAPIAATAAPFTPTAPAQPAANPSAWWDMLQQQFTQAVSRALSETTTDTAPMPEESKTGKPVKSTAVVKPVSKTAAKPAPRKRKS